MGAVMEPVILGALILFLGISNMKGNISSVHWYHRKRVTEENLLPFGKTIGLGTAVCGGALMASGLFTFASKKHSWQFWQQQAMWLWWQALWWVWA